MDICTEKSGNVPGILSHIFLKVSIIDLVEISHQKQNLSEYE